MKMYVSNLSFHTTEEILKDLFSKYGEVGSVKIITDRETNRPRGFAFVEMNSEEQANEAMVGLNNKEIEGRMLSVSVAREKENRSYGDKPFQRRNNHKNFF